MARTRRIMRGGVARRETMWFTGSSVLTTIASADTAVMQISLNAAALALAPFTIIRTRGIIWYRSDQTGASENYGFSYGQAVVSQQASAIGVTAILTPVADRGSDLFFVFEDGFSRFEFITGAGVFEAGHMMRFDSKAVRKVNDDQDIVTVVESSTQNSSGVAVYVTFRQLIKLH